MLGSRSHKLLRHFLRTVHSSFIVLTLFSLIKCITHINIQGIFRVPEMVYNCSRIFATCSAAGLTGYSVSTLPRPLSLKNMQ